MEDIMTILERNTGSAITFDMTDEEYEKFKADDYNKQQGSLNEGDGYDCPICKNKGDVWRAGQDYRGVWTHFSSPCKCMETRRSIRRMEKSGLGNVIREKTFAKYEAPDPWRQTIKSAAMEYAKNPLGWFFMGGQSGAGKSHLCTAICREFLLNGKKVVYMIWTDDCPTLKGLANEADRRMEMIDRFKKADVLYIDDLFKTGEDQSHANQRPTTADIKLAFEIINYRYNNPELLTIISSEFSEDELLDIDEATGGRIFEKSGSNGFSIAKDRSKNYRLRKSVRL